MICFTVMTASFFVVQTKAGFYQKRSVKGKDGPKWYWFSLVSKVRTPHKYGTGSSSDRVRAPSALVKSNRVLHANLYFSERGPGRYCSRFRICPAFVRGNT